MTNVPPDLEARRKTLDSLAKKNGDLARIVRQVDRNGRPLPPPTADEWTGWVRAASPEAKVAIATGARARAEKAEARVLELEAEQAAAERGPDPRAVFADKNRRLLAAVLATDADGNPTTDTNTPDTEEN